MTFHHIKLTAILFVGAVVTVELVVADLGVVDTFARDLASVLFVAAGLAVLADGGLFVLAVGAVVVLVADPGLPDALAVVAAEYCG